jgi:hypothetical protein
LYQALFPQSIENLFHGTLAQLGKSGQKVRLRLTFDSPEIADLPWEYLYYKPTDFFFATHPGITLSRYLRLEDKHEITKTNDLNILVIVSSPKDLQTLDSEREKLIIIQAMQKLKAKGVNVNTDFVFNATLKEISHQLDEKTYSVIHFIGHATFQDGNGYVALVNENGNSRLVGEKTFDTLFLGNKGLCLIILNACKTATGSSARVFSGLATNLVKRGVPAVVAMKYGISDETAILFSEEFYFHFAKGKPVDQIIQEVRRMIAMECGSSKRDFAIPVTYMRSDNGILIDFKESASTLQQLPGENISKPTVVDDSNTYRKKLDELKFVNRIYELNQLILNPSGPKYLQIYGAAGYGKSYLLKRAFEIFNSRADTACLLVNFNSGLHLKEELVCEIARQIQPDVAQYINQNTISDLIYLISKRKDLKNFILMFDTSEFASDGLMEWVMGELLPSLASGLEMKHIVIKIIACGKYLKRELKRYHPKIQFEHIKLTPFEERAIGEMVIESSKIVGSELDGQHLEEIVHYVLSLTNGHPKCAKQVIAKLALDGFNNIEALNSTQQKIFPIVLNTVETEIINEPTIKIITKEIRHVLDALCLFRRFLPGDYLLKPLIDGGYIKGKLYTPCEIIEKLLQTYLVNWQGKMYILDPLVRRTLALQMRLVEPERYDAINNLAVKLYNGWIIGQDLNGNPFPILSADEAQSDFIDENLYHHACLMQIQSKNSKADLRELKDQLIVYRENIRSNYGNGQVRMNVAYLRNQLLEDIELQQLLYNLFGDSFQDIFSVLE